MILDSVGVGTTQVYRTSDPIENFEVEIQLQERHPTPLTSFLDKAKHASLVDKHLDTKHVVFEETKRIRWQEKVFSPKEILRYSQPDPLGNPLSLHHFYYESIQKEMARNRAFKEYVMTVLTAGERFEATSLIFTYTDRDIQELGLQRPSELYDHEKADTKRPPPPPRPQPRKKSPSKLTPTYKKLLQTKWEESLVALQKFLARVHESISSPLKRHGRRRKSPSRKKDPRKGSKSPSKKGGNSSSCPGRNNKQRTRPGGWWVLDPVTPAQLKSTWKISQTYHHVSLPHEHHSLSLATSAISALPYSSSHPLDLVSSHKPVVGYGLHQDHGIFQTEYMQMYIMLWVRKDSSIPLSSLTQYMEKIICTIRVYANGSILIHPMKLDGLTSYTWVKPDCPEEIVYTVNHTSQQLSLEDITKEALILEKWWKKQLKAREAKVGDRWDPGFPSGLYVGRMYCMANLVSATGFDPGNRIHVEYLLDIPNGWISSHQPLLYASTQMASGTFQTAKQEYEHIFNQNIEVELLAERNVEVVPRLFVQVGTLDQWHRYKVLGYGYTNLPATPGVSDIAIQTWRPIGTQSARFQSYFIGGGPEFKDITFTRRPSQQIPQVANKFGLETASSGTVHINFNVVIQSREPTTFENMLLQMNKSKLDLNDMNLQGNLKLIHEALLRAKVRLEALKSGQLLTE